MSRKKQALKAGACIEILAFCPKGHTWIMRGVVEVGRAFYLGTLAETGGADDQTICQKCKQPFKGNLGIFLATDWHATTEDGNLWSPEVAL